MENVFCKQIINPLEIRFKESEGKEACAEDLIIDNKKIVLQSGEKVDREVELLSTNKELAFEIEEKADRAAELVITIKELAFQLREKVDMSAELIIANKELAFLHNEKADRAAELVIANKAVVFEIGEKADRAVELLIANKEIAFQLKEKVDMAAELVIANKEIAFQLKEKADMEAKLLIANKELIIALQLKDKADMAAELMIANKQLMIANKQLITANKAQGEFLVNISHELKTPLTVIYSIAQLFEMYCKCGSLDDNKNLIIKYINSMKLNCHRLSKLINNIVDLSKIEAGFFKLNLSNNNIVEVVEEIVQSVTSLTDIKGLNIIFDTNIEEIIIACDTDKIERIVLNLVSNAIKFSNEGDEIFVQIKDKSEFVQISVKDNGIGIKDEHLDLIFDRFKQIDKSLSRNTEGTGVGLSLVKSIVELHGGSISAESEFGKGSKFTVLLPSRKVLQENKIYSREMRGVAKSVRVELSDIY